MWTLVYWLLTVTVCLLIGIVYSNVFVSLLSKRYVLSFLLIMITIFSLMGVYGYFIGKSVNYLEFNRDRNDTTLTNCFEAPPVVKFEYNYNCGDNKECVILYFEKTGIEESVVDINNDTLGLEIASLSWEN